MHKTALRIQPIPTVGKCAICGTNGKHAHRDGDFLGAVCSLCEPHVRRAEWLLLAEMLVHPTLDIFHL